MDKVPETRTPIESMKRRDLVESMGFGAVATALAGGLSLPVRGLAKPALKLEKPVQGHVSDWKVTAIPHGKELQSSFELIGANGASA